MPYFLSDTNLTQNQPVVISGPEARHILLSFRAKKGEKIKIQGPDGKRYWGEIKEINRNALKLVVLEPAQIPADSKISVTLLQSAVSEKALDFIFQKGAELGLNRIILFNSANTAVKLSRDGFVRKQGRWQKILQEAAKQCERARPPVLEFAADVNQVLEKAGEFDKIFLADICGQPVKDIVLDQSFKSCQSCSVVIGPEGGLSELEIKQFKSLPNCAAISLGSILLRAETAALAAISVLTNLI